jgi:hypothetical protein
MDRFPETQRISWSTKTVICTFLLLCCFILPKISGLYYRCYDPPRTHTEPGRATLLSDSEVEDVADPPLVPDAGPLLHDEFDIDRSPQTVNYGEFTLVRGASQRGRDLLVGTDNRKYNVHSVTDTTTTWQCTVRPRSRKRCGAKVYQKLSEDGRYTFVRGETAHKCEVKNDRAVATLVVTCRSKKRAAREVGVPASRIWREEEMAYYNKANIFPYTAMKQAANTLNKFRRTLLPKEPKTCHFHYDNTFRQGFKIAKVQVDGSNVAYVFSTRLQLEYLARSRTWYADGTFKIVSRPFYQLWTVCAHVRRSGAAADLQREMKVHTGLVYAIMSGKGKSLYREVIVSLVRHMNDLGFAPRVRHVVLDFERASWSAFQEAFAQLDLEAPRIRGCVFHWCQSVLRKINEVGLSQEYKRPDDRGRFLRRLMSLPLVPVEAVEGIATWFNDHAPNDVFKRVTQYIVKTYVGAGALFKPEEWSAYRIRHRTNNGTESYHHKLNRYSQQGLKFYKLVAFLHERAEEFKADVTHVQDGHLVQRINRRTKDIDAVLIAAWDKHARAELTDFELLEQCNRAYRPK